MDWMLSLLEKIYLKSRDEGRFSKKNRGFIRAKIQANLRAISPEKLGANLPVAFLILYLGLLSAGAYVYQSEKVNGVRLLPLSTGSMAPFITPGSLIITKPVKDYAEGDVVTYREVNQSTGNILPSTVTHRIVEQKDGSFITKGDANSIPDSVLVKKENIIGKVVYKFKYLGFFYSLLLTIPGFIVLVALPFGIVLCSELKYLKELRVSQNSSNSAEL